MPYLELELTESLVMENVQQAIAILQQLHMGITFTGRFWHRLSRPGTTSVIFVRDARPTRRLLEQLSPC